MTSLNIQSCVVHVITNYGKLKVLLEIQIMNIQNYLFKCGLRIIAEVHPCLVLICAPTSLKNGGGEKGSMYVQS